MPIQLACEMPHTYLEKHGSLFPYEFCLTHMFEQSEVYRNFYKEQSQKGRLVILDNSVFELGEPVSIDRLLKVRNELRKDAGFNILLVAPDAFNNGYKTIEQTKVFLDEMREIDEKENPGIVRSAMAVAQGSTWEEWLWCYTELSKMDRVQRIGVTYDIEFDVPGVLFNSYHSKTKQQMWKRIGIFQRLFDLNMLAEKTHHLLGTSDPFELYYQSSIKQIVSVDTSFPYVQAVYDKEISNNGLANDEDKMERPVNYFDMSYNWHTADVAEKNLFKMKMWARGRK